MKNQLKKNNQNIRKRTVSNFPKRLWIFLIGASLFSAFACLDRLISLYSNLL